MINFTEQDAFSCCIIYRTNGLGQALLFILNLLCRKLPIERINILCTAIDFSIFLPVADTMTIDYGIVHKKSGEKPPLLMPEKINEPCIVNDLNNYKNELERILPNKNVPLLHYSSMLRIPLFSTSDYLFSLNIFSKEENAFSVDLIDELQELLTPLRDDLRENFAVSGLIPENTTSSNRISMLKLCPDLSGVLASIANVAPTMATTLIVGETGVGKEIVAEAVHELSSRSKSPLVKINCGAIPETLVESELFGHERGAFTGANVTRKGYFEMASGGTLFLDEIGEMSLASQVRLLRVLDSGVYYRVGNSRPFRSDVRLIAATNRDLPQLVREGKFRRDLYFRLAVYPIYIPPLRERHGDIIKLTEYFLKNKMEQNGVYVLPKITQEEQKKLLHHGWSGNVRELEFVIERALIDVRMGQKEGKIKFKLLENISENNEIGSLAGDWPTLEELNNRYINMVVEKVGGRLSGPKGAASILGIHYTTLNAHLKKHNTLK